MKIAVTGKGGVGKTTISAALCYAFAEKGYKVIAIDADPDSNLASALGFPDEVKLTPIIEMKDLIEERTGAKPGTSGGFFKLNPKVDDLPEKLWVEHSGIRLMLMGTVKKGGGGCVCPESVLLKSLVQNLLLFRKEVVIMDMEAGIEHLGRATAKAVNHFVIVVDLFIVSGIIVQVLHPNALSSFSLCRGWMVFLKTKSLRLQCKIYSYNNSL